MKIANNIFGRTLAAVIVVTMSAAALFGQRASSEVKADIQNQAVAASVTPVLLAGNPSCATLNASTDTRFAHIVSNYQLKLDFSTPNGTFPYSAGPGRELIGPAYPDRSVTVSSTGSSVLSWSSQLPVTAVILKTGGDAWVYPYQPFATSDTNLITGDQNAISHLTFCYDEPTGPTAGEATVQGRVVNASGMGIAKAQLVLVNGATGETKITMTNPFGYYSIPGVNVNELYILNVNHKTYRFADNQRAITTADNFTASDFVADPN